MAISVSGCSATIFAYVGEFHDKANRARALMLSSIIYGTLCILAPLIAWGIYYYYPISIFIHLFILSFIKIYLGVINQDWELYIPFIDIAYKPYDNQITSYYLHMHTQ